MSAIIAPEIDRRRQEELVEQLRNLIKYYISDADTSKESLAADPQINALVFIFSRLMEINIQKLNKALDKNFMAFLDILGINLTPSRPARAALSFSVAKGSTRHVLVPKGTQVAAESSPDKKPVVFETESDLTVILPQLVKALSLVPENDLYTDHSSSFFSETPEQLETLYEGTQLCPHRLFIGDSQSFDFKESKNLRLKIELASKSKLTSFEMLANAPISSKIKRLIPTKNLLSNRIITDKKQRKTEHQVKWYRFDKDLNQPVPLDIDGTDESYEPEVVNLQKSGEIPFINVKGISEKELAGYEGVNEPEKTWTCHWIFAELKAPVGDYDFRRILSIESRIDLATKAEESKPVPLQPDHAFFDHFELDLTKDFYPFGKRPSFNSTFYLASSEAFQYEGASIVINVSLSEGIEKPTTEKVVLQWEFFDGTQWVKLGQSNQAGSLGDFDFIDKTCAFTLKESGYTATVTFKCPDVKLNKVFGVESYWIRVRIIDGNYGEEAKYLEKTDFLLNQSFVDGLPNLEVNIEIPISADQVTPFKRVINEEFPSEKQLITEVRILCNESDLDPIFQTAIVSLAEKHLIEKSDKGTIDQPPRYFYYLDSQFLPAISKLTKTSSFVLTDGQLAQYYLLKDQLFPTKNHLLAEIQTISDSFGFPNEMNTAIQNLAAQFTDTRALATYVEATFMPPSIQNLTISYETVSFVKPEKILTYNDFLYTEQTTKSEEGFIPFSLVADHHRSLYLAFDQSVANLPVTLFFPLLTEGLISPLQDEETVLPVLSWEYWSGEEWLPLMVVDNTGELMRREMVQLLPPKNMATRVCFGEKKYWIRAMLIKGSFPLKTKSSSIYTNTVWAYNRITVIDEIIGSSTGGPNQKISVPHAPVLSGQKLLVKETSLTDDEITMIDNEEGKGSVDEIFDSTGNVTGYWVRWHQVPHFHGSTSSSRHYTINHHEGIICFGDGNKGLIPITGKDNIKFAQYQYGGGERGNAPRKTITKLLSSIPYLDKVFNPLAAEGGVNAEESEEVKTRGSRSLRTRNRAVTDKDYEWIVLEATPKAARTKCLSTMNPLRQFKPGWVTIIVVPDSAENRPMPSEELLDEIRRYLYQRSSVNLVEKEQSMVNLVAPNYLRINVNTETIINSISEAKKVEALVSGRLKEFLHPITGGPDGTGWEFGRDVYISEVYEAIEKLAGVNVVESVSLTAPIQIFLPSIEESIISDFSFPAQSRVYFDYEKIVFLLAETLPEDEEVGSFKITGFMEGDQVDIFTMMEDPELGQVKSEERIQLTIKAVSNDVNNQGKTGTLICAPVKCAFDLYKGSIVETHLKATDQRIRSYLVNPIHYGDEVSAITIALPCPGNDFVLRHRDWPSNSAIGRIKSLSSNYDHIFLPEDYLVYAGDIVITTKITPTITATDVILDQTTGTIKEDPRYILNRRSGEIHDLKNKHPSCNLSRMKAENKIFFHSLDELSKSLGDKELNFCEHCFNSNRLKR